MKAVPHQAGLAGLSARSMTVLSDQTCGPRAGPEHPMASRIETPPPEHAWLEQAQDAASPGLGWSQMTYLRSILGQKVSNGTGILFRGQQPRE